MNCRLPILALVLAAAGGAPAQERPATPSWLEGIGFSASGASNWVNNISRTSNPPTRKDAATYEFNLDASRHQQLSADWLLQLGAEASYLAEPKFDLNSNLKAGGSLELQRKFGLGPLAPVLQLNAGFDYKTLRLVQDRGWTSEGGVRLAKRLNSSWKVAASSQWLEHYAKSATFDIRQRTLSVEAVWDLSDRWRLSGSASRLDGNVVANAAWPVWAQAIGGGLGPAVYNYYNSIPWEVTNAYGPGWVSYNVDARAYLWSLTLACALTDSTTLELRGSSAYVINEIDVRYPTDSWGLALIHRF